MNAAERLVRYAEAQKLLADLLEKGWTLEDVTACDARDEPFTVTIIVSVMGESSLGDAL